MSYAGERTEATEAVRRMPKLGNGIGLHRMMSLCEELLAGEWSRAVGAIKITGSNGKGSVTQMVASILGALGFDVGVYTSPHLLRMNERICIGTEPISDADLERACSWFLSRRAEYEKAHPADHVGAFEAFTAVALHYFAEKKPRTVVVEAGIGGRYDPTRVVPGNVAALTTIDLEHTELLGVTHELIAYDKADLCPEGGTLIAGQLGDELLRRLSAYCSLRNTKLVSVAQQCSIRGARFEDGQTIFDLTIGGVSLPDLRVGLLGYHQAENATLAVLLVREWLARNEPSVTPDAFHEAVRKGLLAARWPGRFERIQEEPDVYIDVGHSPDAVDRLVEAVRAALAGRPILLVTGVSYNKSVEVIVSRLLGVATEVIATRAYHRGAPVSAVEGVVRSERPDIPVTACETIDEAMARAILRAKEAQMTVLVAGGLFLAIEAKQVLFGGDPRGLRFF